MKPFVTFPVVLLWQWLSASGAFNLSPAPTWTFRQPSLKTFIDQTHSSYFGYAITLRNTGVFVGAPRAQSDLESQRNVNETGAVYWCSFAPNDPDQQCVPVRFDTQGNTNYEDRYANQREIRSEKKDHQMLGASMDGLGTDGDRFVTCAPKAIGNLVTAYWLHGVCYLTKGNASLVQPRTVHKIKPLRIKDYQAYKNRTFNYMFGEQGFSVHVTDDGGEILMGAPGVLNWCGTVIRYRQLAGVNGQSTRWKNVFVEPDEAGKLTHETVVPNPLYSGVKSNSYLGYSVSSGHFLSKDKLLYVASAPQARNQSGEVYIFDYADGNGTLLEVVMKMHKTLTGEQFGEYFGYSLLTEDFNGDGWPDVAVGAPMHSHLMKHENGAVYVFLNRGGLNFDLQGKLTSSYDLGGRFGTSLGRIGDCNRDGYDDIAIGAPFEGNGVVYIFHGSTQGLGSSPSQRLEPATSGNPLPAGPLPMFGHAISRGIDIDGNGYNDLAIGAPHGELVYVYRTYPIVKVEVLLGASMRNLQPEGGTFLLSITWTAEFPAQIPFNVTLQYTLNIDVEFGRATFHDRVPSDHVILVGGRPMSEEFLVTVVASPTTLHKPIVIELAYDLAESTQPPKEGSFCEHCAVIDPEEFKHVQERIPFQTGCKKETCVSDLKMISIRWMDVSSPHVIGTSTVGTVEVELTNTGESAFLPQVNFTVPWSLRTAMRSVRECIVSPVVAEHVGVLCDLNNRFPLRTDARINYTVIFDLRHLEEDLREVKVHALLLTSSTEQWPKDNGMEITLPIREFSELNIVSETLPNSVRLNRQNKTASMTHSMDVWNNGPNAFRDFMLYVDVPLVYTTIINGAEKRCQVIDTKDVQVSASYNSTAVTIAWIWPNGSGTVPDGELHFPVPNNDDTEAHTDVDDVTGASQYANVDGLSHTRKKRSNLWVQHTRQNLNSIQVQGLPLHRTVFFNCTQPAALECVQLQVRHAELPSGTNPLQLKLHFKLDLGALEPCLREHEDIMVLQFVSDVEKPSDPHKETFETNRNKPYTLVTRSVAGEVPLWVYATSALAGVLLLLSFVNVLRRREFFERNRPQTDNVVYLDEAVNLDEMYNEKYLNTKETTKEKMSSTEDLKNLPNLGLIH